MFCENCGKAIDNNSEFCMECGAKTNYTSPKSSIKNHKVKVVPIILSIFIVPILISVTLILTQGFQIYELENIYIENTEDTSKTNVYVNPSDIVFTCTASSYQTTKYGYYIPSNANDNDTTTTWIEGSNDYGIGEWLQLDFYDDYVISGISLINGYSYPDNNYNRYKRNARIKKVKIETSGGYTQEAILHDGITDFQEIYFDTPIETSYVKITIMEVYEGDSDKFSCISEVKLL